MKIISKLCWVWLWGGNDWEALTSKSHPKWSWFLHPQQFGILKKGLISLWQGRHLVEHSQSSILLPANNWPSGGSRWIRKFEQYYSYVDRSILNILFVRFTGHNLRLEFEQTFIRPENVLCHAMFLQFCVFLVCGAKTILISRYSTEKSRNFHIAHEKIWNIRFLHKFGTFSVMNTTKTDSIQLSEIEYSSKRNLLDNFIWNYWRRNHFRHLCFEHDKIDFLCRFSVISNNLM